MKDIDPIPYNEYTMKPWYKLIFHRSWWREQDIRPMHYVVFGYLGVLITFIIILLTQ